LTVSLTVKTDDVQKARQINPADGLRTYTEKSAKLTTDLLMKKEQNKEQPDELDSL